jgi:hypothetical protein
MADEASGTKPLLDRVAMSSARDRELARHAVVKPMVEQTEEERAQVTKYPLIHLYDLWSSKFAAPARHHTDQARLYSSAIAGVKAEGTLSRSCRHRPVQYLNNILEQDHRAIKRDVKAKQSCSEFHHGSANDCELTGR